MSDERTMDQSCGPMPHFWKRKEAGALLSPWTCPHCGWSDEHGMSPEWIEHMEQGSELMR